MNGVCRICGCTDENGCTVEGTKPGDDIIRTCYWILPDLCDACVVEFPKRRLIVPKACINCAHLVESSWEKKRVFACHEGCYDTQVFQIVGKPPCHQWYFWSGIVRPNKTVAAAQKKCPHFITFGGVEQVRMKISPPRTADVLQDV